MLTYVKILWVKNMTLIEENLNSCNLCPNMCGVDRIKGEIGICNSGILPKVSMASLHFWEEPCISGELGSGAVFFSNCNLSCVFCQNYKISHEGFGNEVSIEKLSNIFLDLQNQRALNINLVSATQYIPQVAEALLLAKKSGLNIPVVYNTNGYESVEALRILEGLVDVYLPDLKYYNNKYACEYSSAPDYFTHATKAILEMYTQVGIPRYNDDGIIQKGLIIRHLLLPGMVEDSKKVLRWIKDNLPIEIPISIMAQYTPVYKAKSIKGINRKITEREYTRVIDYFFDIGLENGFVQDYESATSDYTPDFDLTGVK